jgi:hypothetical protein
MKSNEEKEDGQLSDLLTLSSRDIGFIRYFVRKYHKNFGKGNLRDAHHDAVAIVLFFTTILGEWEDDN